MILDILFLLLMILALYKGLKRGIVLSLFDFIGFFIGLAAALKLSAITAVYLKAHFSLSGIWLPFFSFILVFALVAVGMHYAGKLMTKTSEAIMMGWMNKLGGVLLYMILYGMIFSILIFYGKQLKIFTPDMLASSKVYPLVSPLAPDIMEMLGKLIPVLQDVFHQLEDFFSGVSRNLQ